ncbi:MAG TPA: hydrogenase maturation nickel metallochaperone HypA [Solirubrobacteraceae bacterium]|jgi:hydrogenase nickel incorporation protein HypA/HybF|nr:hydrogenase maturation nickel metallochaperone HypA [Solirubrobacteraceae bacterium]
MHELSIAQAVLDVATRHAKGRRVVKVEVRVGHLRQVVPDSLEFAFALLTPGTALDGCELEISHVPAAGRCRQCGARSVLQDFPLRCMRCEGLDLEVIAGEELLVDALELEHEPMSNERVGHGSHV